MRHKPTYSAVRPTQAGPQKRWPGKRTSGQRRVPAGGCSQWLRSADRSYPRRGPPQDMTQSISTRVVPSTEN